MLALKYRPRSLDDLHGQNQVNLVLNEALARWQAGEIALPAGLMFTGPRGTGKTSTARIVASYVNCESADRRPCMQCFSCIAIREGNSLSVQEIDAASHGSVADMRELNRIARLSHSGRIRVFVIDEVHAASNDAYSALLKQLEEPAPNCIYMLVTTEVNAVPDTIQSRCLRFEFTSISQDDIVRNLERICQEEGLVYEPEVLPLIAKFSHGGMRDAVMRLEHLNLVQKITVEQFEAIWPNRLDDFAELFVQSLRQGDAHKGLLNIRETFNVYHDCFYLLDAIIQRLTANPPPFSVPISVKLIEFCWELRVRLRTDNPSEPILLEALWYLCAKEVGSLTRVATANVPGASISIAEDLDDLI